jgi:predicted P-loop ATPase
MSNDKRAIKQSLLHNVEFDQLTEAQLRAYLIHFAERLTLTTIACQALVNAMEHGATDQQRANLQAFVTDLNSLDQLSAREALHISGKSSPQQLQ